MQEKDLAYAQRAEICALADYQIALVILAMQPATLWALRK